MSNTVTGFIRSTPGSTNLFVAVFQINELNWTFSGTTSTSVPPFMSHAVTLAYDNILQLTSTRQFHGQVGTTRVTLTLTNGPTLNGLLEIPITPATSVGGSGHWAAN